MEGGRMRRNDGHRLEKRQSSVIHEVLRTARWLLTRIPAQLAVRRYVGIETGPSRAWAQRVCVSRQERKPAGSEGGWLKKKDVAHNILSISGVARGKKIS